MSQRSQQLAAQFEQMNAGLISFVESLAPVEWQAICEDEGWSVGLTLHHIGVNYGSLTDVLQAMLEGQTPAITWEMLHQANAEHEREHHDCTKEETLVLLRQDGERAATAIRALDDKDLNVTGHLPFIDEEPITVEQFVEGAMIGHTDMHLPGIKRAVERSRLSTRA